jgi:hypothetical protein
MALVFFRVFNSQGKRRSKAKSLLSKMTRLSLLAMLR